MRAITHASPDEAHKLQQVATIRTKAAGDDGETGICLAQNAHVARWHEPSNTPLGVTRIVRLPTDVGERHSGVSHRKNPVTEHRRETLLTPVTDARLSP